MSGFKPLISIFCEIMSRLQNRSMTLFLGNLSISHDVEPKQQADLTVSPSTENERATILIILLWTVIQTKQSIYICISAWALVIMMDTFLCFYILTTK